MRLTAPRRSYWAQLGLGAATMLLPPLALGAVFSAMLAPPDEPLLPYHAQAQPIAAPPVVTAAPSATAAAPSTVAPATVAAAPENIARLRDQLRGDPIQAIAPQAIMSSPPDAESNARLRAAESTPAAATPRKPAHRRAQKPPPQPDAFPLRTWLQNIGIWPRAPGKNG